MVWNGFGNRNVCGMKWLKKDTNSGLILVYAQLHIAISINYYYAVYGC